jgi:hypothetical protein
MKNIFDAHGDAKEWWLLIVRVRVHQMEEIPLETFKSSWFWYERPNYRLVLLESSFDG